MKKRGRELAVVPIYDPKTNVTTQMTYDALSGITGYSESVLRSYRCKRKRLQKIACYILKENTLEERRSYYESEFVGEEFWKPIQGSDGKFLISSCGRFKRVYQTKTSFLLPFLKKKLGHQEIKVQYNGVYGSYPIARLVAVHFLGAPPTDEHVVRHKNKIKTDNHVRNLDYIHFKKLAKDTGPMSRSKPVVKLNEHGEVVDEYRSAREAGRENYCSYQTILDSCNGKTKSNATGYTFQFEVDYERSQKEYENVL